MADKPSKSRYQFGPDHPVDGQGCEKLADIIKKVTEDFPSFFDTFRFDQWDSVRIIDVFINERPPFEMDSRFRKVRNQAIGLLPDWFETFYSRLEKLKAGQRRFPPKWITTNRRIMANLNRKGNRHVLSIIEILIGDRLSPAVHEQPILVKPDFVKIEKQTNLKRKDVYRYLRELCRVGIIRKSHMDGERGQWFYAIGRWNQSEKMKFPNPRYFLRETTAMKKALEEFDAEHGKR